MGIYYFAVDYSAKEQMWAPKDFSDKCIYCPTHPLPHMIAMKNCYGSNFQIVNDTSTEEEHEFKDVTDKVYEELKQKFPEFNWAKYEELNTALNDCNLYRIQIQELKNIIEVMSQDVNYKITKIFEMRDEIDSLKSEIKVLSKISCSFLDKIRNYFKK